MTHGLDGKARVRLRLKAKSVRAWPCLAQGHHRVAGRRVTERASISIPAQIRVRHILHEPIASSVAVLCEPIGG